MIFRYRKIPYIAINIQKAVLEARKKGK